MEPTLLSLLRQLGQLSLNSDYISRPAQQNQIFSMPTSSQEYIEGQNYMMNGNSSHETIVNEGNTDENYDDDLYVPPSNIEANKDPYLSKFLQELYYGPPVASFQKICYFNAADSYAIPHRGNHTQPASQNIAHILEWWLTEKLSQLSHNDETIPILDESPKSSAENIMYKLREASSVLNGLAKVLINIRAGHVYSLHMIGDVIVMNQNCEKFFQQFPLFVTISIKVQEHSSLVNHNPCQVLVAVEHVPMKDANHNNNVPVSCKFSHHQAYEDTFANARVISSPDGQTFCLLEEIDTV